MRNKQGGTINWVKIIDTIDANIDFRLGNKPVENTEEKPIEKPIFINGKAKIRKQRVSN